MRGILVSSAVWATLLSPAAARAAENVYDFSLPSAAGQAVPLAQYQGKVTLIVNIGTRSGYTTQLEALESLYKQFEAKGFTVLAVPSTDFGGLTPEPDAEIVSFCEKTYHVTFPVFGKVAARGDGQLPLFRYLTKDTAPEIKGDVHWLFTKFLVDQQGKVVERFEPGVLPDDPALVSAVEKVISGTNKKKEDDKDKKEEKGGRRDRRDDV